MQNGNAAPRRDASRGVRGHPHHDFQWPRPHPRVPGGALRVLWFVAETRGDTPIAGIFLSRLGGPLQVHSEGEGRWHFRVSALSAPRPTQVPPRAACSSVPGGTGGTGESGPHWCLISPARSCLPLASPGEGVALPVLQGEASAEVGVQPRTNPAALLCSPGGVGTEAPGSGAQQLHVLCVSVRSRASPRIKAAGRPCRWDLVPRGRGLGSSLAPRPTPNIPGSPVEARGERFAGWV